MCSLHEELSNIFSTNTNIVQGAKIVLQRNSYPYTANENCSGAPIELIVEIDSKPHAKVLAYEDSIEITVGEDHTIGGRDAARVEEGLAKVFLWAATIKCVAIAFDRDIKVSYD